MIKADELVKWFQLKYPEVVKSMVKSSHHYSEENLNPYHLEGSVFAHSMMVMNEAKRRAEGFYLSNELLVSALLHDIGKPLTRMVNEEKQRVSFFNHEPLSAFMCIHILDKIQRDFKIKLNKRLIVEAIALHTEPFKNPKLAERLVHNEDLYRLLVSLSASDKHGRFHEGSEDRTTFRPDILEPIEKKEGLEIVCMVGLPCSGKSTYIKENLKDHLKISRDDLVMYLSEKDDTYNEAFKKVDQKEVDKLLDKRIRKLAKTSENVVVDMTNLSRKSRKRFLNGSFKDRVKKAIVLMPNVLDLTNRNVKREGKTIPSEVMDRMVASFYPPLYDEGFTEIEWVFN